MKKTLLILAVLCTPFFLQAQVVVFGAGNMSATQAQKTLDSSVLRISYELRALRDSTKKESSTTDFMFLEIGATGISKFYSDNIRRMDSTLRQQMRGRQGNVNIRSTQAGGPRGGDPTVIYKNYPVNKISVTTGIAASSYLYEENLSDIQMKWEILPDTMSILDYSCQKATTEFRGRRFEAWFTPEVPINEGPWKFNGLPGLILQVQDTRENFIYTCTGLRQEVLPITFAEKEYIKASRKDMDKLQRRFAENPMEFIQGSMPAGTKVNIVTRSADGSSQTGREIKFPYNPIELK